MLSSLDLTRILAEAAGYLTGAKVASLEFYRKERAVQLYARGKKNYCISLIYHPSRSGFYILPAARSKLETTEKYRPFAREVWSGKIERVSQTANDRIVEIKIAVSQNIHYLIFEVLGPNGNLWLLGERRGKIASLRNKQFQPGEIYSPAALPEKLDPFELSAHDLREIFEKHPETNFARLLEKNLYGFDYYLAQAVLDEFSDSSDILDNLDSLAGQIKRLASLYRYADSPIYVYRLKNRLAYYPSKLPRVEPLDKFKNLSEAQRQTLENLQEKLDRAERRENTLKSLNHRIKKTGRLIKKLEADIADASDYKSYLRSADLLKINLSYLKRGMTSLTVANLYGQGEPIEIKLDPKLSGQENIEQYSRRYRKGREGLDIMKRRLDNSKLELQQLEAALTAFESDFEAAADRFPEMLPVSAAAGTSGTTPALPYKEYQTSTGLTILVGKSGQNNDRTTFDHARPYDLWFHTSQCPGSHVVLRFPHKNYEPSRLEIDETASAAAYFSKARGSAKIPVSYTLKKYVRKPRKAKPGLVLIERETTVIVEPREPEKKSGQ